MPLHIGQVINSYRIDGVLSTQGGMSIVYLATDLGMLERRVLKQNADTSKGARDQFLREAQILDRLKHRNLPKVYTHFVLPTGEQILVMEYVEGANLETIVNDQGPLTEEHALIWFDQLMDAVAYLHNQGVIHRDIKPANLIRMKHEDRVVLVDFGIAKQKSFGTASGVRGYGSPGFAPAEQYSGRTDERSDVYALGATLFFLLTGKVPEEAPVVQAGVASQPSARQFNHKISQQTNDVIIRAMRPQVADRYRTVEELRLALRRRSSVPPTKIVGAMIVIVSVAALAFIAVHRLLPSPAATATAIALSGSRGPTPTALALATATPLTAAVSALPTRPLSPPSAPTDTRPPVSVEQTATFPASLTAATSTPTLLPPATATLTPTATATPTPMPTDTSTVVPTPNAQLVNDPALLTTFKLVIGQYRLAEKTALRTLDPNDVARVSDFAQAEALADVIQSIEALRAQGLYQELVVEQLDLQQAVMLDAGQTVGALAQERYTLRTYQPAAGGDQPVDEEIFDRAVVYRLVNSESGWKVELVRPL